MAAVNYRGVEAVCSYIESTKMYFFAIYPMARAAAKPIFKLTEKTAQPEKRFRQWAEVILSGDPTHDIAYELRMLESKPDPAGEEEAVAGGRGGLSVSFSLCAAPAQKWPAPQTQTDHREISIEKYLDIISQLAQANRLADKLEFQNEELKKQILELDQQLADLEDQQPDRIDGIGKYGEMLMPLIVKAFNRAGQPASPINGIPEDRPQNPRQDLSPKLLEAINELKKRDPHLERHATILAKTATDKPAQFKFFMDALDNMHAPNNN